MVLYEGNESRVRIKKRCSLFGVIIVNIMLMAAAPAISRAATAQVSAGYGHSVELRSDGTVWTWGDNSFSQLGLGSSFTATFSSVAREVSGLSGITAVAAGEDHTLALKSDGTVWSWGTNDYGQLGNNSAADSTSPVQVVYLSGTSQTSVNLTGIVAIAAGTEFSLALDSSGVVWAWGRNDNGQLGATSITTSKQTTAYNISTAASLPVITAIAAGQGHALVVDKNGNVWSWGSNSNGQLGNNSTVDSPSPVEVVGLANSGNLAGIASVAAGDLNSFAITTSGTVVAWGLNGAGQLGNGGSTDSPVPVAVSGLTNVKAISAGYSHALALDTSGAIWAWGSDSVGEMGNGTTTGSSTPQANGQTGMTGCSAGYFFSLALKSTGMATTDMAWAWGNDDSGQLGDAFLDNTNYSYTLQTFGTTNSTPSVVIPLGDMSGKGTVSVGDALLALRIAVKLDSPSAFELLVGDMTGDGDTSALNSSDLSVGNALLILRKAVGL